MSSTLHLQHFIWPERDKPLRLRRDWAKRRWPQYAGTEQRMLQLIFGDGAIHSLAGLLVRFTTAGEWDWAHAKRNTVDPILTMFVAKTFPVLEPSAYRDERRKVEQLDQSMWQPTVADRARLIAHVTFKQRIPYANVSQ